MPPEMINDVNPKCGTNSDIWSLGITVLELAGCLPAKTTAWDFLTPRAPSLTGNNESNDSLSASPSWSASMQDFVRQCLIWDYEKRPAASTLLKHPFILSANDFVPTSLQSLLVAPVSAWRQQGTQDKQILLNRTELTTRLPTQTNNDSYTDILTLCEGLCNEVLITQHPNNNHNHCQPRNEHAHCKRFFERNKPKWKKKVDPLQTPCHHVLIPAFVMATVSVPLVKMLAQIMLSLLLLFFFLGN